MTRNEYELFAQAENEIYYRGYTDGLNKAWELARKIVCPSDCYEGGLAGKVKEIFGYEEYLSRSVFKNFSASEVIRKIEEYEKKQKQEKEFKVGDEVTFFGVYKRIITSIDEDEIHLINSCGSVERISIEDAKKKEIKKTGKNYPQIKELFEQLKESKTEVKF